MDATSPQSDAPPRRISSLIHCALAICWLAGCAQGAGCQRPAHPHPSQPADARSKSAPAKTPTPLSSPHHPSASATPEPAFLRQNTTRAMWLWNEAPGSRAIIENHNAAQDELLRFLSAPHGEPTRAINRLFFAARAHANEAPFEKLHTITYDPLLDEPLRPALHRLLRRLNAAGISTEFLAGQAIWLASDENAERPQQICRDVVAFNLSTPDIDARFAGVHLDIEPHTATRGPYARRWWENRLPHGYNAQWTRRWQRILKSCRKTFDAYQKKTGHHLTLASDVGSDFAHYNAPMRDFLNREDGPLDYISVLNYFDARDNPAGKPAFFYGGLKTDPPVDGVRANLAAWTHLPVLFGLETGPESIAPDPSSFHQEGYIAMHRTIDRLLEDYRDAHCIGVAIHHYGPNAYRDMKK